MIWYFICIEHMAFCFTCLLVLLFKTERIYHEKCCGSVHVFCIVYIFYCTNTWRVPLIIEHLAIASEECFVCWLVLPFRERNNFILVKTYHGIVFTDFQCAKFYSFHNFSLRFILKIFLKFCKFQPRYSYKIYSYKKERV